MQSFKLTGIRNVWMEMKDETFRKIVRLIENNQGTYRQQLTRETRLEQDLAITESEAVELLGEFSEKFNVSIADFDVKKYFPEYTGNIFKAVFQLAVRKEPKYQHVLTIGDLERAVQSGKLN